MAPEEEDVAAALREYTTDPDVVTPRDFVPTHMLYQLYRDYVARYASDPDAPKPLNNRSFGAALIRVFPDLDEKDPETRCNPNRVRRIYNGKQCWGYMGIKGPLSIKSHPGPGRPRIKDVDESADETD